MIRRIGPWLLLAVLLLVLLWRFGQPTVYEQMEQRCDARGGQMLDDETCSVKSP